MSSSSRNQRREFGRKLRNRIRRKGSDYCSRERWMQRFPFTSWLPKYRPRTAVNDLIAGLTVGLTVLPQGLAYASIAKLPSVYGLYAAIMGGFVYAIFGMAKDVSVGPTAIMSLLVSQYGTPLPEDEELNDPTYAILLAFFCGIFQIIMGVLHLGFIANYISAVVISGFTSASAVTIAMSQVKSLLGIHFASETFILDLIETFKHITQTRWQDLTLGLSCIVALAAMRFMKNKAQCKLENLGKKAPMKSRVHWKILWVFGTARNAVIVVVAAAIAYGVHTHHEDNMFTIVGNVTAGLPALSIPSFGAENILGNLNVGLIVIPVLGFLENIAIAKGFARQNNYKVETNQELIALGSCNIGSSFVSGYPITGSFSRSAINNQSGVETQAAGLVTGVLVILSLAFLTPLFYFIPKASLAAVIMYAVVFMIDYHIVVDLWRVKKLDLIPLFVTFFLSLWLGVEYGTICGIVVDIILLLYPYGKPGFKTREDQEGVLIITLEQGLRYPAMGTLHNLLDDKGLLCEVPRSAIIDFSRVASLDYSVVEGLKDVVKSFRKKQLSIMLTGVKPGIHSMLDRAKIEGVKILDSVDDALHKVNQGLEESQGDASTHLVAMVMGDREENEVAKSNEHNIEDSAV
ncbi:sodium-independent sulfate anion transporter-like [Diadema antillarum]|uniref:sodium-independent sulfate anion transporter-like n=1 Tax=Diadema antillarum TaxID=105358 RepID=UPI003A8C409F